MDTIDRDQCVSWVGGVILEAQEPFNTDFLESESEFIINWRDQLPEIWRENAKLSALKVGTTLAHKNRYTIF